MFKNFKRKLFPLEFKLRRKWATAKDNLSMNWNSAVAKIYGHQTFWTYAIDGDDYFDGEFETMAKAESYANDAWETYCEDNGPWINGESNEADVELILFFYDEKTGDHRIIQRENSVVYFEYYHGDYAEHFRQSDYI